MASESTSPDPPTTQVDVKEPTPIENFELKDVSHTDSDSGEQVVKVGELKEDEAGTADIPVPKVEEIKGNKKLEDEIGSADIPAHKIEETIADKTTEDEAGVAGIPEEIVANKKIDDGAEDTHFPKIEETVANKKTENEAGNAAISATQKEETIADKKTEDEAGNADTTVPKIEETVAEDKIADENALPLESIIKPGSDPQSGVQLEGTEVGSAKEIGSENDVAESKESAEAIKERPTELREGTEPGGDLVVGSEQEKSGEAFAEDEATEKEAVAESSIDIIPESQESKIEATDVGQVPTVDNVALELQESRIESPDSGEVPTEYKGKESQLEVTAVEVPPANKVQAMEIKLDASAMDESPVVGETHREQSGLNDEVSVEKTLEVPVVEEPAEEVSPSETEAQKEQSDVPLISDHEVEVEKKVDEGLSNNDNSQEAAAVEVIRDSETPRDLPEQVVDLSKKDEAVNEVVDSIAVSETVANEPTEEQIVVQTKIDDTVVSTDREGQLTEAAVETATQAESKVETGGSIVEEPSVKTTLHDLMKVEIGSELIKELVKEPTAENAAVVASTVLEHSHDTDLASVVEKANEQKKAEPDAGESEDVVKETVPPPVGPTTDGDEGKNAEMTQETSEASLEKTVAPEPVKVEESDDVAENSETVEVVKKADEEVNEGEKKEETVEPSVLNSDETAKDAAEETGKQEVTIKSIPRQSNIMSKVKQSIVKVKKAITGKSPSSKSSSSKADAKAKQ